MRGLYHIRAALRVSFRGIANCQDAQCIGALRQTTRGCLTPFIPGQPATGPAQKRREGG